jgi:hypothetical protein
MKKYVLLISSLFCMVNLFAQLIAFPGAEGYGRFATGGRGTATTPTTVYEVTNLADVNAIGSFRYALSNGAASTPRTIMFRVSGTIRLTAPLQIRSNTTIAGQTAPGDGICIADHPVSISGDNIIVRYIRFRLGDRFQNLGMVNGSGDGDALSGTGRKNIIIDHCTMSWSADEACSIYRGDSTTLQWNIISEPLNYSYHFESGDTDFQQHAYGGIWGGRRASLHHNLIAHIKGRAPRFDGSRNLPNSSSPVIGSENADFRNNVIYNWSDYNVNGGEGGNYNIVNNYYKYGPNTPSSSTSGINRRFMVINPGKQTSPALPYGKYFVLGNVVDGSTAITNNNWLGAAMGGGGLADTNQSKMTTPFAFDAITTHAASVAYDLVLHAAGASLPKRDTLDQRIANDVRNRTGRIIDVQGGFPHGTAFAQTVNAWPTLNSTTAPVDADKDGMPDEWETRRGLNPNNANDRQGISTNGFTHLENYLNGDTIVSYGINNTCINANKFFLTNAGNWQHLKDTNYAKFISTDTMNIVVGILDNTVLGEINGSYLVTTANRVDGMGKAYLNRNITISATSSLSSPLLVRFYLSAAEYNALKLADNTIAALSDLRIVRTATTTCSAQLPTSGTGEIIIPTNTAVFGTYQNGYYLEFTTSALGSFFVTSKTNLTTSIANIQFAKELTITPNPATHTLFVKNLFNEKVNTSFFDITGKNVINNINLIRGMNKIDISILPKGVYFLRFKLAKQSFVRKITKG